MMPSNLLSGRLRWIPRMPRHGTSREAPCLLSTGLKMQSKHSTGHSRYVRIMYQHYYEKGRALSRLGMHTEAVLSFDNALSFQPKFVDALQYKGLAQIRLGRFEDAEYSFDQALRIRPNNGHIWTGKGIALFKQGKRCGSHHLLQKSPGYQFPGCPCQLLSRAVPGAAWELS